MEKYPLVQQFLNAKPFGPDHAAQDLRLSDPIVPALEYFLSLKDVRGYKAKIDEIRTKPVGSPTRNDRRVQWASLCAEIGAVCLLGKKLQIRIVGFEEVSPRATSPNVNCDIVAVVNGDLKFIEVKRNAAEDKQLLPDTLKQSLKDLECKLPFSMTPELVDRNYDCANLDEKLHQIKIHVEAFQRKKLNRLPQEEDTPLPFKDEAFTITFHLKSRVRTSGQYLSPVSSSELSQYLVGPGEKGRDGRPMVPMVQQAVLKGADYLMCRVTGREGWSNIVEKCFEYSTYTNGVTYFANDPRLGSLDGVILFSRYDNFCVVNNLRIKVRNWLVA